MATLIATGSVVPAKVYRTDGEVPFYYTACPCGDQSPPSAASPVRC